MMKKLLLICTALLVSINYATAQDSAFDDLTMNGLATYEKLRKDYYIGALFIESMNTDPDSVISMQGMKRMEMRIVVDKWSPRRFAKEWKNAILLSNELSSLDNLTTQIQSFTNIPHNNLIAGDRITIDMYPERHTTIYLNNKRVFRTTNNDFFYALLNTWIGPKPPSSDFKGNMLKLPTDDAGTALLLRYEELSYSDSRKRQVAAWSKSSDSSSSNFSAPSSAFAPPGSSVSARPSSSAISAPAISSSTTKANTQAKKAAAKKAAEDKKNADLLAKAKADQAAAEARAAAASEALRKAEAEKARDEAMGRHRSEMYQAIAQNIKYPKRSQQRGERGRVIIKVVINREGKILNLSQELSSNYSRLNNAAEKAVKASEPFDAVPAAIDGEEFEFSFPVNF